MRTPDPLADARSLLELARLIYRHRASCGKPTASLVPIGRALVDAMKRAETASAPELKAALARVDAAGTLLWQEATGGGEGIRDLIQVALAGVRQR